jgi:hypothetical protein
MDLTRVEIDKLTEWALVDGPGSEADSALKAWEAYSGPAGVYLRPDDSLIVLGLDDLLLLAEPPIH